jgi:hypothetical protein
MQPFMDEVEQSNADLYVSRPADLPGIVDIWKKTKKIGSYSNVVLHNITIKLKDLNPRYQQVATLTPERALRGAERLAAAATLSRRSSFSSLTARPSRPRSGTSCWTRKISCLIGAQPKCRSC